MKPGSSFSLEPARRWRRTAGIFVVTAGLGAVAVLWSIYETNRSRHELEVQLRTLGAALSESLGHAVQDALLTSREIDELTSLRLLDHARLIARLDLGDPLEQREVEELAQQLELFRIVLLDGRCRPLVCSTPVPPEQVEVTVAPYLTALAPLCSGQADQLVLEARSSPDGGQTRLASAVARPDGGAVLVVAESEQMLLFHDSTGATHLLDSVVGTGGILYAQLHDAQGQRLTGTKQLEGAEEGLAFDREIQLSHDRWGTLRIGLSTATVRAATQAGRRRTLALGVFVLVFAVALTVAEAALSRIRDLRGESARNQAVTDAVLDGLKDAVIVLDRETIMRRVNPAAERLLGRPAKELLGRPCRETPCIHLGRLAEDEILPPVQELDIQASDGSKRPSLVSVSHVRDANGRVVGRALVLRDLSRLKLLETQTRRAENVSALGRLTAAVAHEVRNPLNSIAVGVQRLQREFKPAERENDYERLTSIVSEEVERLDAIVDRFLDLARAPQVRTQNADLAGLVRDALPLLARGAPEGVEVVAELEPTPTAQVDPTAMRQILLNLVRNGIEAVQPRGTVRVSTSQLGDAVVLTVSDDGPGVAPQDRDRVFEFGFTTKPAGTGMGLPIVQRLVTEMGGAIDVDDAPGGGTVVRISLPRAGVSELRKAT
jgi:PAS domain S-box-containing protein